MGQLGAGGGVRQLERLDEHARLLVAKNVATDGFTKGLRVAIDIENVVLNLESKPKVNAKQVERLLLVLVRSCDVGSDLQRRGQENRRLEANHFHILVQRHRAMLELHVVLLPLADFGRHAIEELQDTGKLGLRHAAEQLIGLYHHLVARQNGRVVVPTDMHGRLAAAHGGVVHDIVVQQGEVVKHLDGQRCRKRLENGTRVGGGGLLGASVHSGCGQHQGGTQTLAARGERIFNRLVQAIRRAVPIELGQSFFDERSHING